MSIKTLLRVGLGLLGGALFIWVIGRFGFSNVLSMLRDSNKALLVAGLDALLTTSVLAVVLAHGNGASNAGRDLGWLRGHSSLIKRCIWQ